MSSPELPSFLPEIAAEAKQAHGELDEDLEVPAASSVEKKIKSEPEIEAMDHYNVLRPDLVDNLPGDAFDAEREEYRAVRNTAHIKAEPTGDLVQPVEIHPGKAHKDEVAAQIAGAAVGSESHSSQPAEDLRSSNHLSMSGAASNADLFFGAPTPEHVRDLFMKKVKENDALIEKYDKLRMRMEALEQAYEMKIREKDDVSEKLSTVRKDLKDYAKTMRELDIKINGYEDKLKEKKREHQNQMEILHKKNEIALLEMENEHEQSMKAVLEGLRSSKESKRKIVTKLNAIIDENNKRSSEILKAKEAESESLKQELDSSESALALESQRVKVLHAQVDDWKSEYDNVERKFTNLKKDHHTAMNRKNAKIANLENKVNGKEIHALKQEIQTLKKQKQNLNLGFAEVAKLTQRFQGQDATSKPPAPASGSSSLFSFLSGN